MTALPSGSPSVLRNLNRTRVVEVIRLSSAISRVDLAREVGLSKPTVNEIVAGLLDLGILREVGSPPGAQRDKPGPRPKLIAFRPEFGFVIGADVGGDKLLVKLADLRGTVLASKRIRARGPRTAERALQDLRRAVEAVSAKAGVSRSQIAVVSVGTPGVVDPVTQRITFAPQILDWERVDLAATLRDWFDCPVLVDTEVHLSMLAERWLGAGRDVDDLVYVNLGIGVGAGILIRGERYRGAGGAAGEIGYLPFPVGERSDELLEKGFGRFESAVGGMAYARLGQEAAALPSGARMLELAGGIARAIDARIVFRAAAEGDAAAGAIVEQLVARLAVGVAATAIVLDPSVIIIGGGMSRAGASLMIPLERGLTELLPRPPRVVLSDLGEEAVALGAVTAACLHWESNLYRMFASGSG